jgi:hypothetical protein
VKPRGIEWVSDELSIGFIRPEIVQWVQEIMNRENSTSNSSAVRAREKLDIERNAPSVLEEFICKSNGLGWAWTVARDLELLNF